MTAISTAQKVKYTAKIVDGFGKPAPVDETTPPSVAVSDETVLQIVSQPEHDGDGNWSFEIRGLSPGQANVSFSADADVSEEVDFVIGQDTIDVNRDPRFDQRSIQLTPSDPTDA